VTVGKASLTITASSTSMTYGGTPPAPTASYSAFAGSDTVASLTTAPTCSTSATSSTPVGTDTGANTCSGAVDGNYTITYVNGTLTVNKATPTVSLVSSLNPVLVTNAVIFTATVSSAASTPTGSVSFSDGTTPLGTGTLAAGVATYTSSSLTVGLHSISAAYSGDANFASVTSSAVAQVVQDFTVSTPTSGSTPGTSASATILPGGTATYALVVGPTGGTTFPSAVTFSVSGLPAGATATITPLTLPAGSALTNVTLVIQLANQILAHNPATPLGRGLALAMVGGMFLLPFGEKMRRSARRAQRFAGLLLLVLAATCATLGFTACGGGGSGYFGQPVQNYTVTVTATSGSLSHTTTVNLTVK